MFFFTLPFGQGRCITPLIEKLPKVTQLVNVGTKGPIPRDFVWHVSSSYIQDTLSDSVQ